MATAKERREQREAEQRVRMEQVGEAQVLAEQARAAAVEQANRAAMRNPGAVKDTHGETMERSRSGQKVIVACKLGVAYYDIQLTKLVDAEEQTLNGMRSIKRPERYGPVVRLRGTAYPRGTPPEGFPEKPVIVDGAALNFDIDADFWHEWVKVNHLHPLVVNRMIFAHEERGMVVGMAREEAANVSGLDPINPRNLRKDPRVPRSTRADLTNVETEESRAKSMERLNLP